MVPPHPSLGKQLLSGIGLKDVLKPIIPFYKKLGTSALWSAIYGRVDWHTLMAIANNLCRPS